LELTDLFVGIFLLMPGRGRPRIYRDDREATRIGVARYRNGPPAPDLSQIPTIQFQNLFLAHDPRVLTRPPAATSDTFNTLDDIQAALDAIPSDRESLEPSVSPTRHHTPVTAESTLDADLWDSVHDAASNSSSSEVDVDLNPPTSPPAMENRDRETEGTITELDGRTEPPNDLW
jgi:hypothetical protein